MSAVRRVGRRTTRWKFAPHAASALLHCTWPLSTAGSVPSMNGGSRHSESPRRRQIVGRHVVIEIARAGLGPVDPLGDSEGRRPAEVGTAAVARHTTWTRVRDPCRLAWAAAQRSGGSVVGEPNFGAAVTGALAPVADEVARPSACRIAPAGQLAKPARLSVRVEQR